jgi:hypothetical protein
VGGVGAACCGFGPQGHSRAESAASGANPEGNGRAGCPWPEGRVMALSPAAGTAQGMRGRVSRPHSGRSPGGPAPGGRACAAFWQGKAGTPSCPPPLARFLPGSRRPGRNARPREAGPAGEDAGRGGRRGGGRESAARPARQARSIGTPPPHCSAVRREAGGGQASRSCASCHTPCAPGPRRCAPWPAWTCAGFPGMSGEARGNGVAGAEAPGLRRQSVPPQAGGRKASRPHAGGQASPGGTSAVPPPESRALPGGSPRRGVSPPPRTG